METKDPTKNDTKVRIVNNIISHHHSLSCIVCGRAECTTSDTAAITGRTKSRRGSPRILHGKVRRPADKWYYCEREQEL